MLARMAVRLGLAGVAFRPSHYHVAYAARHEFRFADPARQARFEALVRDLGGVPLVEATTAVANGAVRMNGAPYRWEADEMVLWFERPAAPAKATPEGEPIRFTYGRA